MPRKKQPHRQRAQRSKLARSTSRRQHKRAVGKTRKAA